MRIAFRSSRWRRRLAGSGWNSLRIIRKTPRGHSHLVLGFTKANLPIHAVCAVHEGTLVIITLYRPDSKLWQDYRTRKGEK